MPNHNMGFTCVDRKNVTHLIEEYNNDCKTEVTLCGLPRYNMDNFGDKIPLNSFNAINSSLKIELMCSECLKKLNV